MSQPYAWREPHLPPWRPTPPPPPVWRARASAWCGREECSRYVLATATVAELEAALAGWRCPRCERPAF